MKTNNEAEEEEEKEEQEEEKKHRTTDQESARLTCSSLSLSGALFVRTMINLSELSERLKNKSRVTQSSS